VAADARHARGHSTGSQTLRYRPPQRSFTVSQQEFPAPDPLGPRGGDIIEPDCCPELAAAFRAGEAVILRRCEDVVPRLLPHADRLTHDQVRDSLPDLLRHIADALESRQSRVSTGLKEVAPEHAATRFQQRFDVDELVAEYRILRQIILEEVHRALGRDLHLPELIALDVATGFSIQEGVATFVDHEKQEVHGSLAAESRYLSFLAHDLRNNLNACTLTLELLRQRMLESPQFRDDAQDMESLQRSIAHTIEGMDRLLQAERLRRRAAQFHATPVHLSQVAGTIAHQLTPHAEQKGLLLEVSIPADAVVHSDGELIALVLQNLVGNAIKYSARGTVRVAAAACGEQGAWALSVSDEGPGIAPEHRGRLFEAYVRGETHGQTGVGLGLAIAFQAARLLGATLALESTAGVGSTFRLTIPSHEPRPPALEG
jgi:signal transduction histidine kinase